MLHLTCSGALGNDAELKYTPGGTTVLHFSVASNDRAGQEKVTTWVRCSLFGKRAESIAKYLLKGTRVCVVGQAHTRLYQSQGETKASLDLTVSDVDILGGGQQPTTQTGQAEPQRGFGDSDIPF